MFDNRFAGLTYPVELGGRGGQPWHESIYREEAANFDVSSGFIASTIAMLGPTLMRHGTDEQKAHYVPRLLSGEYSFCQLFSEPGAGSDLAGLACRADPRRRRVRRHRPEGVELGRAVLQLGHAAGAHRPRRRPSTRASPSCSST